MSNSHATHRVRGIGVLVIIAGLIFALVGAGAWVFTSIRLGNEGMTTAAATHHDADSTPIDLVWPLSTAPGTKLNNPIAALAQATIIAAHSDDSGRQALLGAGITEAQIGDIPMTYGGLSASNFPDATPDQLTAIADARTAAGDAANLISSLFTSVLAFGVSLFAFGVGIVFILIGWALCRIAKGSKKDDEFDFGAAPVADAANVVDDASDEVWADIKNAAAVADEKARAAAANVTDAVQDAAGAVADKAGETWDNLTN